MSTMKKVYPAAFIEVFERIKYFQTREIHISQLSREIIIDKEENIPIQNVALLFAKATNYEINDGYIIVVIPRTEEEQQVIKDKFKQETINGIDYNKKKLVKWMQHSCEYKRQIIELADRYNMLSLLGE